MVLGRFAGESAVGVLAADAALIPLVRRVHGTDAGWTAAAVVAPMLVKRITGNQPPARRTPGVYLRRLLLDRDTLRNVL
jgi:hypothetical protein